MFFLFHLSKFFCDRICLYRHRLDSYWMIFIQEGLACTGICDSKSIPFTVVVVVVHRTVDYYWSYNYSFQHSTKNQSNRASRFINSMTAQDQLIHKTYHSCIRMLYYSSFLYSVWMLLFAIQRDVTCRNLFLWFKIHIYHHTTSIIIILLLFI